MDTDDDLIELVPADAGDRAALDAAWARFDIALAPLQAEVLRFRGDTADRPPALRLVYGAAALAAAELSYRRGLRADGGGANG